MSLHGRALFCVILSQSKKKKTKTKHTSRNEKMQQQKRRCQTTACEWLLLCELSGWSSPFRFGRLKYMHTNTNTHTLHASSSITVTRRIFQVVILHLAFLKVHICHRMLHTMNKSYQTHFGICVRKVSPPPH